MTPPNCPFYGLRMICNPRARVVFVTATPSRCGLVVEHVAMCVMEENGQTPDWSLCERVADRRVSLG